MKKRHTDYKTKHRIESFCHCYWQLKDYLDEEFEILLLLLAHPSGSLENAASAIRFGSIISSSIVLSFASRGTTEAVVSASRQGKQFQSDSSNI